MSTTDEPEDEEPPEEDGSESESETDEPIGSNGCCVPESEMYVIRDRNFNYPWKDGNKYSRVCPECGSSQFCSKSYWQERYHDPEQTAHIIRKSESTPLVVFECPFEGCGGMLVDFPDECPECESPIEWEGGDGDDPEEDDDE